LQRRQDQRAGANGDVELQRLDPSGEHGLIYALRIFISTALHNTD
jgi:hypothetical protein